jgi:hypothetical protein
MTNDERLAIYKGVLSSAKQLDVETFLAWLRERIAQLEKEKKP